MNKLPTLYHKGKKGEMRMWIVWAEQGSVCTRYGLVGGKLQFSNYDCKGKNVGRKNETTPKQQAELEAKSLWQNKLDRKYSLTMEETENGLRFPMLAHNFKDSKAKKFMWPGDAQAKLDGVRCLARWEGKSVHLTSKSGKPWNIPHVESNLAKWLSKDMELDGELYCHGESCQQITSWCRSSVPGTRSYKPESLNMTYHIYDLPVIGGNDTLPWEDRRDALRGLSNIGAHVKIEEIYEVHSPDELAKLHDIFVAGGYEGAILRAHKGQYLWGYRSNDLLKYKAFEDVEFEVVGATEGVGKFKGAIVWICKNDQNDETFECTIRGSMERRRQYYRDRAHYIGLMLTVRFLGRTDKQIPKIAVGKLFRDEKDL